MVKLNAVLWVCLWLSAAGVEASEVYEWLDADGVDHMADTPPPADQEGVELLRVNGNDVNVFHDDAGADDAELASGTSGTSESSVDAKAARVPPTDEDCAEIHGRTCNWDAHWRAYAERACTRVGDSRCHDKQHLKAHYDPRVQARHVARHARHHR